MSFILDALRKAEQERALGQPPDVRSLQAGVPATVRTRRWSWWLGLALLVNLVLLTAIGWWLLGDTVWQPLKHELARTPDIVPTPAPAPTMRVQPQLAAATSPAEPAQLAPIPTPASKPEPERMPQTIAVPESTPKITLVPEVPAVPAVTAVAEPVSVPLLRNLSASLRSSIPSLKLDVHVYSTDASKRFVLINGRRYREGDWLGEGPLVESINDQGVVLHYREQRFVLPVPR